MIAALLIIPGLFVSEISVCESDLALLAPSKVSRNRRVEFIRELTLEDPGQKNEGIFEVRSRERLSSERLILKVPLKSVSLKTLDRRLKLLQRFRWAPRYYGIAEVQIDRQVRRGLLFSFSDGRSIFEPHAADRINRLTLHQVYESVRDMLRLRIFPGDDFQYLIRPDGSITIIDFDDYLSLSSAANHGEASFWLHPNRSLNYLFAEDVRRTRVPKRHRQAAHRYAEKIWTEYQRLYEGK